MKMQGHVRPRRRTKPVQEVGLVHKGGPFTPEVTLSNHGKLVEDGASLFHNLSVVLLEILNDAKQKNPAQISNIKSLGGRKSQEHLTRLADAQNYLGLFTRIMGAFTKTQGVHIPADLPMQRGQQSGPRDA